MEDPQEEYRKAQHALKTSLFQWTPDWLSASHHFDHAGKGFKLKQQYDEAIQSYTEAAKAHLKADQSTSAAKSYEEIADILVKRNVDNAKIDKVTIGAICEAFENASRILTEDSDLQRASNIELKAAKAFEKIYSKVAENTNSIGADSDTILEILKVTTLKQFMSACEKIVRSEKAAFVFDAFPACLGFCLRIGDYNRGIDMLNRMIKIYSGMNQKHRLHQCYLSLVIVHLKRNDAVAARNLFSENLNDTDYLRSSECEAAENVIRAWEARDEEAVNKSVKNHAINSLDRQVVLLARSLNPYKTAGLHKKQNNITEDMSKVTMMPNQPPQPPPPSKLDEPKPVEAIPQKDADTNGTEKAEIDQVAPEPTATSIPTAEPEQEQNCVNQSQIEKVKNENVNDNEVSGVNTQEGAGENDDDLDFLM
uniref:Gamma-soluble NSF attachment protein n=1 Tax=Aplanochytrium stocchinoi TaxID=215587 RepID=A0A7S3V1A7_9STRA|mmetsp:Transcript_4853/g.5676  ORF Transcript_4853/g.5676 Transcript_4853/m.5676 type:complete len:423 (+) Transcript_4853:128-1396(+)